MADRFEYIRYEQPSRYRERNTAEPVAQRLRAETSQGARRDGRSNDAETAAARSYTGVAARPVQSIINRATNLLTSRSFTEEDHIRLRDENTRLRRTVHALEQNLDDAADKQEFLKHLRTNTKHERDCLREQLGQHQQVLRQLQAEKDSLMEQRREMERNGQKDKESIRHLQEQVTHYKSNISVATKQIGNVADDVIKDKIDTLFRDIQGFVVRNFKGAKFEFALLPEEWKKELTARAPTASSLPKGHWYNICISAISCILFDRYEAKYYLGLSDNKPLAAAVEIIKRLHPEKHSKTKPWLEATRELVNLNTPDVLRESDDNLKQHMAIIIEQSIVKAMQVEWSEVKHRQLAKILGTGMELFRLLQQQQALFFIQMPLVSIDGQAQDIQPEWEEDVDGLEDEETLAGRLIEISVFPGFYKSCDERGESSSVLTVVSKARVVPGGNHAELQSKGTLPGGEDHDSMECATS